MRSSEDKSRWVLRWRYVMTPTSRPGIWRLKDGGYFVRVRVTDPRTGRRVQCARTLRGLSVTIWSAIRVRDQLRHEGRERVEGTTRSLPPWSEYAASLFEAKVAEGKLSSSKSRERWGNVLARLIPVFGRLRVDELRTADVVAWRDQVARWIRDGMPSTRRRDEGKNKIVKLSPVTANGWLSILKVICAAMTKHYELARDPAKPVEYFPAPRVCTREHPPGDLGSPDRAHAAALLDGPARGDARRRRQGDLNRYGAAAPEPSRQEAPVIAPLNTALDSWPGIKLNRGDRAELLRPARGVKSGVKGVKRVVIASSTTRICGAGEGFRNRLSQRAVIHARSAKFCWFREPRPRQGTTQNDAVRDRVGQPVGNGWW
jgi:hypothetical protein